MNLTLLKTESKVIDGLTVMVTQLPATHGLRVGIALVKLLGPSIGALVAATKANPNDIQGEVISKALENLVGRLDETETISLLRSLLQNTRIDNQEINDSVFNMCFAGKYTTLLKVAFYTIQVNHFFDLDSIGTRLTDVARTMMEQEKSSTGLRSQSAKSS